MAKLFFTPFLILNIGYATAGEVEATLNVTINGKSQSHTAAALLKRSVVTTITIQHDVSYRRPMRD